MGHRTESEFSICPAVWDKGPQRVHQGAAPCNVIRGSGMTRRWIRPVAEPCSVGGGCGMTWRGICHIGIKHVITISTISYVSLTYNLLSSSNKQACSNRFVNVSLHQSAKFYPYRTTLSRKNDVMFIYNMADLSHLGFKGPIMGSLKSRSTTSYRSSIETIALKFTVFEKIAFLHFWRQRDKQTDTQTNGQIDGHHLCVRPQWVMLLTEWQTDRYADTQTNSNDHNSSN